MADTTALAALSARLPGLLHRVQAAGSWAQRHLAASGVSAALCRWSPFRPALASSLQYTSVLMGNWISCIANWPL